MHSSRMRTVRCSGCLRAEGVSTQMGVSAWWGTPPPVNRITHRCENIAFPQLRLRTVISLDCSVFPHLWEILNAPLTIVLLK